MFRDRVPAITECSVACVLADASLQPLADRVHPSDSKVAVGEGTQVQWMYDIPSYADRSEGYF